MSTTGLLPDPSPAPLVPVVVPPQSTASESFAVGVTPTAEASAATAPRVASKPLPPKPQNARYESLDMWRGVACLCLVLYHAAFFCETSMRVGDVGSWSIADSFLYAIKKTWCGVPIFFVISGYCITAAAVNAQQRNDALRWYFFRRFRRIYPPFWIVVALV